MKTISLWLATLLTLLFAPRTFAETNSLVANWLAAQAKLQTWSADFVQTRTFKSLSQPLTSKGHAWFVAPNRFRWELGSPPQTIAVRAQQEMLVLYPRLKRVERYPLTGIEGKMRDALALLETGFPRSQADLESRLRIVSQTVSNDVCEITLQPKSENTRQMIPEIRLAFGTTDLALKATQLQFADGSTMRNDFINPVMNPKLDDSLFTPKIPAEFKVVEPLKEPK